MTTDDALRVLERERDWWKTRYYELSAQMTEAHGLMDEVERSRDRLSARLEEALALLAEACEDHLR